jgi:hypothetical protein
MHIMAIIDKEDNRLLAAAHHFHYNAPLKG